MVDGFLLFTILDVWRMMLPLGLTLILLVTEILGKWHGDSYYGGICDVLSPIVFRLTFCLLVISAIVGLLVAWILGYPLPESHIAVGPWGYEEILGFLVAGMCLWRASRRNVPLMNPSPVWIGCSAAILIGVGVLWIGRWDAMANEGNVQGGWFVLGFSTMDLTRVVPKAVHLFFASLAAGGLIVTLLGLFGWRGVRAAIPSIPGHPAVPSPQVIRYGVAWMLSGLVPQMLIGPWLFLVLGEVPRGVLIDGSGFASGLFFVSVMAAFVALVLLNASFMVPHVNGLVWGGLISVGITLALMGIIRYVIFLNTLHVKGIPIATGSLTPFHLLTVMVFLGLLCALLVRWCVTPRHVHHSSPSPAVRLDKRFSAN